MPAGVDSIAIKDMSGMLTPMAAFELVSEIKKRFAVRLHLHCHATPGMAEMPLRKAIAAGVDGVDTPMSAVRPPDSPATGGRKAHINLMAIASPPGCSMRPGHSSPGCSVCAGRVV